MAGSGLHDARWTIESRLADERGTLGVGRPAPVCLTYPSPYRVGMSSLGFQTLYRLLNEAGIGCHRAFLPDGWEPAALPWPQPKVPILSYEGMRPISEYPTVAISVAYELEVAGVIRLLEGSGIPVLAADRGARDPIVIAGGPLTTTNPSALLPFCDVLIAGDGEELLPRAIERISAHRSRSSALSDVASLPHTILGEVEPGHFEPLPLQARAPAATLPAHSAITTPNTELADMFLIEPERGCSRQCTFCVMRGLSTGGMRLLRASGVLQRIPEHAKRVGLVGAAVTDHPELEALVDAIVSTGRGVGISSLRADRLTPRLVRNLARGGYQQITVASDGISERMRERLQRRIPAAALRHAASLVHDDETVRGLKVYQMIGVPGETEEDVDELIDFARELASMVRLTLTFSVLVAKRNTPLDGAPFFGVKEANTRLNKIRKALRKDVIIRPQSPRWAHVEWLLAQRGPEGGHAALQAVHRGGRYRDWIAAFEAQPTSERLLRYGDEEHRASKQRRYEQWRRRQLTVVS